MDVIRKAAEFVGGYDGKLEDALTAVSSVGGFVESCGGAGKARSALEAYRTVAEVVQSLM